MVSTTPKTEAGRKHRGHLGRVTMLPLDYFDDDIEAIEREAKALDVDRMAQIIREVDGNHDLGTAALAEAIVARLNSSSGDGEAA